MSGGMTKAQVVKFWKALESSTSQQDIISAFTNKKGYASGRTLERLAQADTGFREGLSSGDVAKKTGWNIAYVDRIRGWWKGEFSPGAPAAAVKAALKVDAQEPSAPQPVQQDPLILKAREDHLAEVRSLVADWKQRLTTPWAGAIYLKMASDPTRLIETNPLFDSLRKHLPFPALWQDFSLWKKKTGEYIAGCRKIMRTVKDGAKGSVDADSFEQFGTEPVTRAVSLAGPLYGMMKQYKDKAEADPQLKLLREEIAALETGLHQSLQEMLLRRDYIEYTCALCPGQPIAPP